MSKSKISPLSYFSLPLIDRYIITQLLPPFLFGVGLFSSLGVAIANLSDLSNKIADYNLPLTDALQVLLLKIPEFIAYALPVSLLLSTLLTYGRASNDSETIAFRSCGIGLYRLVLPTLIFSLIITVITFFFNEYIVPSANFRATSILVKTIPEDSNFVKNQDIYYPTYHTQILQDGTKNREIKSLFYAEEFNGKSMKSVTVLQWVEQKLNQIIIAQSASWNPPERTWDFVEGTIYQISPTDAAYGEALHFKTKKIPLPSSAFDFAKQSRDPYEMSIDQALDYLKLLQISGDEKKLRMFKVRIQQKIAFPFVCVIFALIGASLGSLPRQMGRGTSFGLSVAIVFSYYLLGFLVGSLGLIGIISPFLAAWIPNFVGFLVGGLLLWRINS